MLQRDEKAHGHWREREMREVKYTNDDTDDAFGSSGYVKRALQRIGNGKKGVVHRVLDRQSSIAAHVLQWSTSKSRYGANIYLFPRRLPTIN